MLGVSGARLERYFRSGNVRKSENGEGLDGRDRLEPAGDRADGDVSVVHYIISRSAP